jgi:hypothetical protein
MDFQQNLEEHDERRNVDKRQEFQVWAEVFRRLHNDFKAEEDLPIKASGLTEATTRAATIAVATSVRHDEVLVWAVMRLGCRMRRSRASMTSCGRLVDDESLVKKDKVGKRKGR